MYSHLLDRWRNDLRATITALGTSGPAVINDPRPVPPPESILRVNSAEKADASVFLRSGASDLLAIVEALADAMQGDTRVGESSRPAQPTVMELGCGVGRLLRHAPGPAFARMIATDVNAASLDWCRTHLPGVEYFLHSPLPPIKSLPAASVDVAYAHSVFTHIPLEHQAAWLEELERIMRPGGCLAITFLSRVQQDALLDDQQQVALSVTGQVQILPLPVPGHEAAVTYGAVCQTVARQEAAVGARFDIVRRLERPGRQDVVAARRR